MKIRDWGKRNPFLTGFLTSLPIFFLIGVGIGSVIW